MGRVAFLPRATLEGLQAFGDLVEGLLVDREDRHLRRELLRIVERADLHHDDWTARWLGGEVGAAVGAELARHRPLEVAAREGLGRALGVLVAGGRHDDERVGRAAGDVLAFAAVALRLQHRLALGDVADVAAIASTFQLHLVLLLLKPPHDSGWESAQCPGSVPAASPPAWPSWRWR